MDVKVSDDLTCLFGYDRQNFQTFLTYILPQLLVSKVRKNCGILQQNKNKKEVFTNNIALLCHLK